MADCTILCFIFIVRLSHIILHNLLLKTAFYVTKVDQQRVWYECSEFLFLNIIFKIWKGLKFWKNIVVFCFIFDSAQYSVHDTVPTWMDYELSLPHAEHRLIAPLTGRTQSWHLVMTDPRPLLHPAPLQSAAAAKFSLLSYKKNTSGKYDYIKLGLFSRIKKTTT